MSKEREPLIGTWRLLAWEMEFQASGKREPYAGSDPKGYWIFTPEGRTMALLTGSERTAGQSTDQQAALFRSMIAYAGTYGVNGDQLVAKVDVSWNEAWNGSDQVRTFRVHDNRLDVISAWQPHPTLPGNPVIRGVLSWERVR